MLRARGETLSLVETPLLPLLFFVLLFFFFFFFVFLSGFPFYLARRTAIYIHTHSLLAVGPSTWPGKKPLSRAREIVRARGPRGTPTFDPRSTRATQKLSVTRVSLMARYLLWAVRKSRVGLRSSCERRVRCSRKFSQTTL